MELGGIQEEAGGSTLEPAAGAWWPGARLADRRLLTQLPLSPPAELKENAEHLHIETARCRWQQQGPCLWFRLTVCNRYHGAPRRQQQLVIRSFGIFYGKRGLCREGDEVMGIRAAGTGEVR
ncbi:hypothetical protein M9H77_16637 [Catharanthus roseus]|uniref:Uncharacterized protein n=1 Tax=Catharanthus roseus TaxID=4058 RepID=A0ACC0B2B1_CATRO|nr:hypothetical protein M9H77_16637 [Catharanthus roseus]